MAAAKREHVDGNGGIMSKKARVGEDSERLGCFLDWCRVGGMYVNPKVDVTRQGVCAQYGMVARDVLETRELLFEIPRSLLLTPQNSSIAGLLKSCEGEIRSNSGWVPLLLALLHEYTKPDSKWRPYYSLVPDYGELSLPMFWSQALIDKELQGTGVPKAVERDLKNLTEEFNSIVLPFVRAHEDVFPPAQCQDIELYKRLVAFVMAYSFTEPIYDDDDSDDDGPVLEMKSPPMMVPMADILNHVTKNNAFLEFRKDSLRMLALRPIGKGEEVYNTYGQLANGQLLHMYGFSEPYPNNHLDTVDIPMSILYDTVAARTPADQQDLLRQKWAFLQSVDLVTEDGVYVVGSEGILTEEEMHHSLKVLVMDAATFLKHKDNDGWTSDHDDDEESLTNDDILELPRPWKDVLAWTCAACIARYASTLDEDRCKLRPERLATLSRKQQFSLFVRYGQLKLLHGLLDLCRSPDK